MLLALGSQSLLNNLENYFESYLLCKLIIVKRT